MTNEALWVLHDSDRYLWMLDGGKFLLRDRNVLRMGDSSLSMKDFLRFPGRIRFVGFDAERALMIAETTEPIADPNPKPALAVPAEKSSPSAAALAPVSATASGQSAGSDAGQQKPPATTQSLMRILRMDTGKVVLIDHTSGIVHLPLEQGGFYEPLRARGANWLINFQDFHGGSNPLLQIESTCTPDMDVLARGLVLASACVGDGSRRLTAFAWDEQAPKDKTGPPVKNLPLWTATIPPTKVWPQAIWTPDGLRIARAALDVTHPIDALSPLDPEEIRGQSVQVYDAATGKVQLAVPASPALDSGGNFALSPSGKRFAVLNAGAIQIFNLPAVPALPAAKAAKPTIPANPANP